MESKNKNTRVYNQIKVHLCCMPTLKVPVGSGGKVSADGFKLYTRYCPLRGSAQGIPCKVFLGEKM